MRYTMSAILLPLLLSNLAASAPSTQPAPTTQSTAPFRITPLTDAQITATIADLDSPDYKTRQSAADRLRVAGHAVYEPLKKAAAESTSVEFLARAKPLLEDLRYGITPATDPQVATKIRSLLEVVRSTKADEHAFRRLANIDDPHLSYLMLSDDPDVVQLFPRGLHGDTRPPNPLYDAIRSGDTAGLRRVFDAAIRYNAPAFIASDAAYAFGRGTLAQRIREVEAIKLVDDIHSAGRLWALVQLHQANGDLPAATRVAREFKDRNISALLLPTLLAMQGKWDTLVDPKLLPPLRLEGTQHLIALHYAGDGQRYARAIRRLRIHIALDDPDFARRRAADLINAGLVEDALDLLDHFSEFESAFELCRELGQYTRAFEYVDKASAWDASRGPITGESGGLFPKSWREYNPTPRGPNLRRERALVRFDLGEVEKSRTEILELAKAAGNESLYVDALVHVGLHDQAKKLVLRAMEKPDLRRPGIGGAALLLPRDAAREPDHVLAVDSWWWIIRLSDPEMPNDKALDLALEIVERKIERERLSKLATAAEAFLRNRIGNRFTADDYAEVARALADSLRNADMPQQAASLDAVAAAFDAQYKRPPFERALAALRNGKPREAIALLDVHTDADMWLPRAMRLRATALADLKDPGSAETEILARTLGASEEFLYLALTLKRPDLIEKACREYIRLNMGSYRPHRHLAEMLYARGEYQEALAHIRSQIFSCVLVYGPHEPRIPPAHLEAACRAHLALRATPPDPAGALAAAKRAVTLHPESSEFPLAFAAELKKRNHHAEAAALIAHARSLAESVLKDFPRSPRHKTLLQQLTLP